MNLHGTCRLIRELKTRIAEKSSFSKNWVSGIYRINSTNKSNFRFSRRSNYSYAQFIDADYTKRLKKFCSSENNFRNWIFTIFLICTRSSSKPEKIISGVSLFLSLGFSSTSLCEEIPWKLKLQMMIWKTSQYPSPS